MLQQMYQISFLWLREVNGVFLTLSQILVNHNYHKNEFWYIRILSSSTSFTLTILCYPETFIPYFLDEFHGVRILSSPTSFSMLWYPATFLPHFPRQFYGISFFFYKFYSDSPMSECLSITHLFNCPPGLILQWFWGGFRVGLHFFSRLRSMLPITLQPDLKDPIIL